MLFRSDVDSSSYDNIGGLVGHLNGAVYYSYSIGNVTGNTNVGGLAGDSSSSGFIYDSYSLSNVEAMGSYAGGLVGRMYYGDHIYRSFAAGNVSVLVLEG